MSPFFEDPALYRSVLENLPIGVYVLDRDQHVRFWNRGAERLTGHLAHEVVGQVCADSLPHFDPEGRVLAGDDCSITTTLREGRAVHSRVFTLHKQGHRLAVLIRTLPLIDEDGLVMGVAIAFEEATSASMAETNTALMCGCLDPLTGVSTRRMTKAVLAESLVELEETRAGLSLLRIRILGLKELSPHYGVDSVAVFLRTSVQTIRHSLRAEDFLGRWGDDEFLAMLHTGSPVKITAIAEVISQQIAQSEISWWGDRFRLQAEVEWIIASPGDKLEELLGRMKPIHTNENAADASASGEAGSAASQG
ncbi:MAG: diguanylate cyclase [Acidobacteria bacterium]|nr:diguanylate cyclase [Acidobacteriota bacterium]